MKVSAVFCPSGTDAEYLALLLALGDRTRPLCNIIVGPQEVGSGSEAAAAGLHFDTHVPHGPLCDKDSPVSSCIKDLVEVQTIKLRIDDGQVRERKDIDTETEALVTSALAKGQRVLLHVVSHSKTGLHAPSASIVRELTRLHGDNLILFVDAAQGRTSREGVIEALSAGMMVQITGSKFYGGPPFSGALLVPERLNPVVRKLHSIPAEFGTYFSRCEFPEAWAPFVSKLPRRYNLALLLRWSAALEAIRTYYAVPGAARLAILKHFEKALRREFARYPSLELETFEPGTSSAGSRQRLESRVTVFPFRVKRSTFMAEDRYLQSNDLKLVAQWLNEDVSRFTSDSSHNMRTMLAAKYHIGQPVFEGSFRHPAVLRIAFGAALVCEAGKRGALVKSLNDHLKWLDDQVREMLVKLDWIVTNFGQLVEMDS